jgi:hypothetical protein
MSPPQEPVSYRGPTTARCDSLRYQNDPNEKVKHRATEEVIVGGVLGPIDRPEVVIAGRYRGKDSVKPLTKVQPRIVIEVAADAAVQAGQWRHGLRYVRLRAELQPEDVPTLPASGEDS